MVAVWTSQRLNGINDPVEGTCWFIPNFVLPLTRHTIYLLPLYHYSLPAPLFSPPFPQFIRLNLMAPHRTRASDPVQCPTCGKTISRKADLDRHVKTHSENEDDRYYCPVEGCLFSAVQESGLKTHMNRHERRRPNICPVENCPFTTPDPGSLTRHRIEQHAYVPLTRIRSSDDQESEGVPEPARRPRRQRRTRRNTSRPAPQSASSPSIPSPSSSLSLTDEQAQQGSNIASATYDAQSSGGSVSSWDTHSPASLSPASDLIESNQLASASPYSAEAIINNFACAGSTQSPWDIPSPPSLSPNFYYQGSQTAHSSNAVTHFAQVAPQSQSPSGSSSSLNPYLPSLLLADEHVAPVGSAMIYHHNMTTRSAQVGHSHFVSTASQTPMTQHPVPEQGYPYAMVPAAPLFPTIDRSTTEEVWNECLAESHESYAATPSVSMPTTSYGAGNSLVSAPTTLPSYSVSNVGALTPVAIPRYGNQYHVGNMPPPASMSSTSYGNQFNVGSMLPPASTSSTSYSNQYNVGNMPPLASTSSTSYGNQYNVGSMLPPASTSSTSSGAQYPINYTSDGFYGHAVGNMLPPASTSSTSYGAQYPIDYASDGFYGHTVGNMLPPSISYARYPTNHGSHGNHGHTNAMSFGAQITHQQTNGSFANPNMNGYSQATYPQASAQGYLHTTHAGTSGFRRFSPY
ncbi:hypothetical protein JVT61DRAFT_3441 [Boletus reticuloceps]|uniref:C2H2-type domain-containing protein n=1 Tax=Boletus reticuloceps TaxID=495285 RepID=A0A8I3A9J5_9AGAM|nr:hypothetical protein JVT61DRAFT_3441 [Boletus reticuloceps]